MTFDCASCFLPAFDKDKDLNDLDRREFISELVFAFACLLHAERLRPDLTNDDGQTPTAQCALVVAAIHKAHPPPKCSHHARFAYSRSPLDRVRSPRRLPQRPRVFSLDVGPHHLRLLQLDHLPSTRSRRAVPLPGLERSSRRQDHLRPCR